MMKLLVGLFLSSSLLIGCGQEKDTVQSQDGFVTTEEQGVMHENEIAIANELATVLQYKREITLNNFLAIKMDIKTIDCSKVEKITKDVEFNVSLGASPEFTPVSYQGQYLSSIVTERSGEFDWILEQAKKNLNTRMRSLNDYVFIYHFSMDETNKFIKARIQKAKNSSRQNDDGHVLYQIEQVDEFIFYSNATSNGSKKGVAIKRSRQTACKNVSNVFERIEQINNSSF